jgi:hypothetical protein
METTNLLRDVTLALRTSFLTPAALTILAIATATVFAVLLVIFRTDSTHVLLTRVWRFAMGQVKPDHTDITTALIDRDALIRFRYFLGVKARTAQRAAAIARWAREHDEELADISRCHDLFDHEHCRLIEERVPSAGAAQARMLGVFGFLVCVLVPWYAFGLRTDQTLVRHHETWFVLSKTEAFPPFGSVVLKAENCPKPSEKWVKREWPREELGLSLCQTFRDTGTEAALRRLVWLERMVLVMISIFILPFLLFALRWARGGYFARKMLTRINTRRTSSGSTPQIACSVDSSEDPPDSDRPVVARDVSEGTGESGCAS